MHPKELQKLLGKAGGDTGRGSDQPADAALYETGKIYTGVYGTFWTGSEILLPFYISDPPISGSADSPDHQG